MLTLSEDKSPYAQFCGLIEAIESDRNKEMMLRDEVIRKAGSEEAARRSLSYKLLTERIATYNSVISLIGITDIIRNKVGAAHVPHVHAEHEGRESLLRTDDDLKQYLHKRGATHENLWLAFTERGISITRCDEPDCLLRTPTS